MTITLQAVNELIADLENAGELSIKERKYLELAKAYQQLAEENVRLKTFCKNAAFDADYEADLGMERGGFTDALNNIETPATDRIVAGFKADGVAEREKTITFTAAKKRKQDGVALIAIGKPYKIHNDDVIGKFFIGERGRYGVITMDCLDYFKTSDEYAWEFSLREGADK
ncbi:hypothetical protein [Klebsiella pneumoniae]|uniref:hypothetical protein n=1 Tax=Klebsiella pneumoniae TaxID=573 RepID=UPI001C041765|nr:hypothetical protein [Klebsiella pneumoniae]